MGITVEALQRKLRYASKEDRQQWFHHRLLPYEHFIPINNDLKDIEEKLNGAIKILSIARKFRLRGKRLAIDVINEQGLDIVNSLKNWKYQTNFK